jgi:hypothetical protein
MCRAQQPPDANFLTIQILGTRRCPIKKQSYSSECKLKKRNLEFSECMIRFENGKQSLWLRSCLSAYLMHCSNWKLSFTSRVNSRRISSNSCLSLKWYWIGCFGLLCPRALLLPMIGFTNNSCPTATIHGDPHRASLQHC